jgi:hypothetical protein
MQYNSEDAVLLNKLSTKDTVVTYAVILLITIMNADFGDISVLAVIRA